MPICCDSSPANQHASPHVALNDPDRQYCAEACVREGLIPSVRELCASYVMPSDQLKRYYTDCQPLAPRDFRWAGKDQQAQHMCGGEVMGTTCKIPTKQGTLEHVKTLVQRVKITLSLSIAVVIGLSTLDFKAEIGMRIIHDTEIELAANQHASPHVALNDPDRHTCAEACVREGLIPSVRELCASYVMPSDHFSQSLVGATT